MNVLGAVLLLQVAVSGIEERPVVVRVRDSGKAPVKGAHLVVEPAVPAEMALGELLAKRAGASKDDGILDLGPVPSKDPVTLRIGAPGHRMASLKLPAGFEAGRRDVVLAPNQDVEVRVSGLAGRKGEARPEVTLARCRNQFRGGNCNPGDGPRRRLDAEGRATFARVDGGFYVAQVAVPGAGVTREFVEVARDGDAPAAVVDLALGEWTFRGTTRLHDGTAVVARVSAMEFVRGSGEGTAAETRSAADGSFELRVVSRAGNKVLLKAECDEPRAVSNATTPIPLDAARPTLEDVTVDLDATTLEVAVRDARSGEPLPGCTANVVWEKRGESSWRGSQLKTNADGIAREVALSGGTVRLNVTCPGYYAADLGVVPLATDETKRVDVSLAPARDLVLAAVDESARPRAGASVFVLEGPPSTYGSLGLQQGVALAGLTDEAGELSLKGESFGGRLAFVVAPGRALGMALLPAPDVCDRPEDCRVVVAVGPPRPSAGVVVRSESGEPVAPRELTLRRGALPLPLSILAAVLHANGLFPDEAGPALELREAAFLPDGVYAVSRARFRADPATKKETWIEAPVGSFAVPNAGRVELVDRDGVSPKPSDVAAPRVAGR